MQLINKYVKNILRRLHRFRVSKMHLDYIAGLLTIPVLVTAVLINFANIDKQKAPEQIPPTPTPQIVAITPSQVKEITNTITQPVCQKKIGPISISYPQEGQTISDNPVCISIDYSDSSYCSVVWSYRINNGTWSDYNSNSPCLYNLANGNIQFQLRVNSTVTTQTETFTRNFVYSEANNPIITPTPTPQPLILPSATLSATQSATTH